MTILCPAEFYSATKFAHDIDDALDAAILLEKDGAKRRALVDKRGQGARSLMACFGARAFADDQDTKNPYFPEGSEVHFVDGRIRTIAACSTAGINFVRDTFIYSDFSPHSFFFREEWLDRDTRQVVSIYDRCWYLFDDGRTKAEVDRLGEIELEGQLQTGQGRVYRTFREDDADKAISRGVPVRETMTRRHGMCGGIIFHADYDGTARKEWGSWSTHT